MFFKKRETITRYEYFLKSRKEDRTAVKANSKERSTINAEDKLPLAEMTAYNASFHQEWATLPVKSPPRKKFWVRENSKKEVKNFEYPII